MAAALLADLSSLEVMLGDQDAAYAAATEALELRRARGEPLGIAHALFALGEVVFCGDLDEAAEHLTEAVRLEEPNVFTHTRIELAHIEAARGRDTACARQLCLLLPDLDPLGDIPIVSFATRVAGHLAYLRGDPETAVLLLRAGDRIEAETGAKLSTPNDRRIWSEALEGAESVLSLEKRQRSSAAADGLSPEAVLDHIARIARPLPDPATTQ